MPHFIKPMLASTADSAFNSKDWIFEIKLDGFRALAALNKKEALLYSRNLILFNERFPELILELNKLHLDAVLDGEIVALDNKGRPRFQLLQNLNEANSYYYVFDILYLNGKSLMNLPLIERKALLKKILKKNQRIVYVEHIEERGIEFFNLCKEQSLEGMIAKNKASLYIPARRSTEWLKIKAEKRQEFLICGFTEPRKGRKYLGALLLGYYDKGVLKFAGHVGGGFTDQMLKTLHSKLLPFVTKESPFENKLKLNSPATWVKPHFICEVKFKEWTDSNTLRMPIFLGLREDKPPKSVVKEMPMRVFDFITHEEKIYWPEEKITKGDLLNYYHSIAPYILPYLKDRPQSLRRYPHGIDQKSFFQKNIPEPPDWLPTFTVEHRDRAVRYLMIQNLKSLLYAVNLGCIELHPWFSRTRSLEFPDFMVFDLDPVEISFEAVRETALHLHALLEKLEIDHYCKTSGGRGLHIALPLKAKYTYEQAKYFAELIAILLHAELPKITSLERSPKNRRNRVYIDCYQNNFGQTLAAPYSVRAKPHAPVSTPLEWEELEKGALPQDFTIFTTAKRLEEKGDIFKEVLKKGVNLKKALRRLDF